ncbi:MAG: hypothetical protein EP341_04595, partial [Sphingomonadales bacterium]
AARLDGQLHLSGQFAISSYDRIIRERIVPFSIAVPLAGDSPAQIAQATGIAIDRLGTEIATNLRR